MSIPIIDLFAGPGGLGEGFSSLTDHEGKRKYEIRLSIEKDRFAHQTLELRAFYRAFAVGKVPPDYYRYLRGEITRDILFESHRLEAKEAENEAWEATLGDATTPDTLVDERIRSALGSRPKWVLIGGPPCQAYSLVGRSRVIGAEGGQEKYNTDHKHTLYKHYLRILAVHRPPVFVMENVKGLLSAKLHGQSTFERILTDLRDPSKALPEVAVGNVEYRLHALTVSNTDPHRSFEPKDFVVHSEKYGIPQARHRIIIVGVRSDMSQKPGVLEPEDSVSVEQVIGDLPRLRSGLSKQFDSPAEWRNAVAEIANEEWLCDDSLDANIRHALKSAINDVKGDMRRGGAFLPCHIGSIPHQEWYRDPLVEGACNHETRGHIKKDLHRYFFAAVYARIFGRSPLLENFPRALLPNHGNVEEALKETKFNDRFRVQVANRPSTTVVSHIAKDGHYFIHYDPAQCRSLTVREAARLQTFPDNYKFEGPRTEQYKQVGNAVPPLLARKIAEIVLKVLNQ